MDKVIFFRNGELEGGIPYLPHEKARPLGMIRMVVTGDTICFLRFGDVPLQDLALTKRGSICVLTDPENPGENFCYIVEDLHMKAFHFPNAFTGFYGVEDQDLLLSFPGGVYDFENSFINPSEYLCEDVKDGMVGVLLLADGYLRFDFSSNLQDETFDVDVADGLLKVIFREDGILKADGRSCLLHSPKLWRTLHEKSKLHHMEVEGEKYVVREVTLFRKSHSVYSQEIPN